MDVTRPGLSTAAVVAGRYRVIREIGRGNMGKVYRVEHLNTGEEFAMKVLLAHAGVEAALVERFKREARAPALIKSPHVVRVIDADVAADLGGAPFLVMELLQGCDLQEYLRVRGKLPPGEALGILEQVARALDRAHAVGIVHRDLKPANVFLHRSTEGVVVRLLDFGISKLTSATAERPENLLTVSGVMMGTPLYMPPEQAVGAHHKLGPGTDIWALGMLTFHLLSGKTYWKATSMAELMAALLAGPLEPATAVDRTLPPAFDAWFSRACRLDVSSRFSSVAEQITELSRALNLPEPVLSAPAAPTLLATPELESTLQAAVQQAEAGRPKTPGSQIERRSSVRTGGERRQVTGLFCRMTASSRTHELDPEDLRDAIADYNATCESVLERFGSPLSQSMGDGLLAYFGYPKAYGDDAKRAVTAGLEIVEAVLQLSERFARERSLGIAVSVGIHTGIVVVGEGVTKSLAGTIAGQAPDQAQQVETRASDNSVVVSAATERLLRGSFECESLGRHALRGTAEGTELFRVLGKRSEAPLSLVPTRSQSLIGRASELGLLLDRWEQACSGSGQVVFVSGEAGLGKSRLLEVLRDDIERDGDWLECACSPYFSNTALYPVLQAFAKRFGLERGGEAALSESRLEAALARYDLPQSASTLLAHAFDLAKPAALAKLNLSPPRQKQALLEALATLLLQLSREKPLALVVEDLHWADPSTLDLLSLLVEHCAGASVLIILSARPEFSFPWSARSNSTELKLTRLSAKRVESLVRELTAGKELPRDLMDQLLARTDGIPLFVEELTRMVVESGALDSRSDSAPAAPRRELAIPSTLRDSLTARLDRLGPAKVTAQLAATIGRDFSFELLAAISPLSEEELRAELRTLQDADLIFQRGLPPNAGYTFRHSLIQEAAYDSLLKKTRREAHSQIAQSVIERFPERAAAQPEFLAHHFEQAEQVDQASQHLTRAGQRALERSALAESAQYLTRSLSLLASQPPTRERLGSEAMARTALGVCLMFSKGYAAAEVEDNYGRALVIDRELGGKQPLPVLWGLWIYHHVRGRYELAYGFTEQLLTLAREAPEPNVILCSHLAHGSTSLLRGMLEPAREHLQRTLELYSPEQFASHAHVFGQDPGVFAGVMLSWNLWLLGHPQRARLTANAALKLGRDVAHPNSLAFALGMKAALHSYCGEAEGARVLSEELLRLCAEQGLVHWVGLAQTVHGWALAELSPDDPDVVNQGLREALAGRASWQAVGSRAADTHWAAMLVELYCRANQPEPASEVLASAFSYLEQSDERTFEAELHRLKGELSLRSSDTAAAEQSFKEALAVAERQKSRALALRASMSLHRLYQARGAASEGRALLTRSLSFFEAGESTRDLVTARRLLAEAT